MKRAALILVVAAALGAGGLFYYNQRATDAVQVNTSPVTRGPIVETVGATGTLQAVTTVQVGSQVSGSIQSLGADFNSIVKKGQVIARLDPSLIEAQVRQARANLAQAEANLTKALSDLERVRVQLVDAQQKYARAAELAAKNLLPLSELDAAKTAVDSAQAGLSSQQATVTQVRASVSQSQASLSQAQVNLEHTVITAPIDGIVTQRSVDVGQTVAASLQSPTLFVIAADLTKMQVYASIDEADVGRIRPNQHATFRVDAYPTEEFTGTVVQVRLQPVVVQNVTTYGTVIDVPNPQLKLKPGMTATVKIEVARRDDVLRVPNTALRFRPTNEMFAALDQPVPPDAAGTGTGTGRAAAAGPATPPPAEIERRPAAARNQAWSSGRADTGTPAPAETIDALFGPLPVVESQGRAWLYADGRLQAVRLRLGLTDGANTEVLRGELQEGSEVVTGIVIGGTRSSTAAAPSSGGAGNPLLPQRGGPPGGGGRGGP
jgi:HlyD family secretion protein